MSDTFTINEYLDAAAVRIAKLYNLRKMSDRELARKLGVAPATLHNWRSGRMHPADAMMAQIAERAGMSVEVALMDLNAWRAEEPARSVYANLARRMGRTVAAVPFCAVLLGSAAAALLGNPSHASTLSAARALGTNAAQIRMAAEPVYIMENIRRPKRRFWRRVPDGLARLLVRAACAFKTTRDVPAMSRVSPPHTPLFNPPHRLLPGHI